MSADHASVSDPLTTGFYCCGTANIRHRIDHQLRPIFRANLDRTCPAVEAMIRTTFTKCLCSFSLSKTPPGDIRFIDYTSNDQPLKNGTGWIV